MGGVIRRHSVVGVVMVCVAGHIRGHSAVDVVVGVGCHDYTTWPYAGLQRESVRRKVRSLTLQKNWPLTWTKLTIRLESDPP